MLSSLVFLFGIDSGIWIVSIAPIGLTHFKCGTECEEWRDIGEGIVVIV